MKYIVSVTIGPVQSFIAAARRCRDLWFGSNLLSEVSKAAAHYLKAQNAELIFPAPSGDNDLDPGSPFTAANKILAIVETDRIRDVVNGAESAARERLSAASKLERWRLRGLEIDWNRYAEQISGTLEVYAAWTPYTRHQESRTRVEYLSAGRKAVRDFSFYEGTEGEPKSSLDGVREHVIKRRSERLFESNLKQNEWLDGMGIMKRFGGGSVRFDSTLDVAGMPYAEGQRRAYPKAMEMFDRFVQEHFPTRPDEPSPIRHSLLYRQESRQIFEDDEVEQTKLLEIRAILEEPKPPYYAMLLGDGDRMGKAISGIDDPKQHRAFSNQLSKFAARAQELIDSPRFQGCAIYCGGDDVLGLLPLHTALACAEEINKEFRAFMSSFSGLGVSFSAGLVVAHALEPLTEVREWAQKAEKAAKDESRGGRDALCIAAYPRSGGTVEVWGHWGTSDRSGLPHLMGELIQLSLDGAISHGLAHDIRRLLDGPGRWPDLREAIVPMARCLAAKKTGDGTAGLLEKHANSIGDLDQLVRAMLAARLFARARKEAEFGLDDRNPAA